MESLQKVQTGDGSYTFYNPQIGEHYHSKHGALQESKHVFLQSGTQYCLERYGLKAVSILEVGFGTGLNYLVTADFCIQNDIELTYHGIERFPLGRSLLEATDYRPYIQSENLYDLFYQQYPNCLENMVEIMPKNTLRIHPTDVGLFQSDNTFDVLYFDAFAAIHQPEMWTLETLQQVCQYIKPGGVFVTYAITGNLKRSMRQLGFTIQKIPGAPGKREMLRAILAPL